MANPGGVGTKFMSVNLNKSYGPVSHSSYGQAASRTRPGSGGGGGGGGSGGGGGGMVVLSRPRPVQKPGAKLSVPPPLNLPSLRKEHERFDSSGPGSSAGSGGSSGIGPRPNSSGLGWTKPGIIALQEKDGNVTQAVADSVVNQTASVTKLSTGYVPPSARLGVVGVPHSVSAPLAEKTSVLRGEDFPSLKAALPSNASGGVQKQKDGLHRKQKHVMGEELSVEQTNSSSNSLVHMYPQGQSPHHTFANGSNEGGGENHGLGAKQQARKQEYFPGPLPLVMLNPRSDWADDERDTGHGFADRVRDHGFSKKEAYWDRDFELPRNSILPHKPVHSLFERRGKLEDESGKVQSIEMPKVDPYRRDARTPSREGNSWRTPLPLPKDESNAQEVAIGGNGNGVGPVVVNREMAKENIKYIPPYFGDNSRDSATGNREPAFGRRDMGHGNEGSHQWNHMAVSSISRGVERSTPDRYINEQFNRYRGGVPQDGSASKSSFASGGKMVNMNDPKLNFGREKHAFSKSERTYVDEPFTKDFGTTSFDEHDPFSGGIVFKRKKDLVKHSDFHDPVRESFEAELERVQKMQEQERRRIIEEQERAMEQARREEEDRQRLIREEEERRRRLEEEAREAAWRAEQERMEAIHRAEEQRIAREEEKQRMLMEEERRKQAAKQKLLELEAKIAMRQTEAPKVVNENTAFKALEFENWEDSERMVERITTSGSSDSSGLNRPFELGSRSKPYREHSSGFLDRGKAADSWRRDVFEDGNNSSSFLIENQDNGGSAVMRKEYYGGGGGYLSSRSYPRGGMQEFHAEDFAPPKGHRLSASGNGGDPFGRNLEIGPEFHDNSGEKYSGVGWGQGQGRSRSYPRSPYSEGDELYSYGRSRYSMRQPRVLPPPSLASMYKDSFKGENESPGPSAFVDNNMHYSHGSTTDTTMDIQPESTMSQEQIIENSTTRRCDSQSSLSVSSPPSSPTHLSHDDLDECGEASALTEGKEIPCSGNESVILNDNCGTEYISGGDEEDWALDNDEELQEQEEYDEDEDGYEEEDEVHEGDDGRVELTQEFEHLGIEDKSSSRMMENLVLGFDEGVEVGIPPSDEFERSSRNEESTFGLPAVSVGNIEQLGPPVDRVPDNVKAIQDSCPQPASDLLDIVHGSSCSGVCSQNSVTSSVNVALPRSSDLPVNLQFGLFSGPSLIPSPVPAIQIGSIQMPLHLHPSVGPSLSHLHPSQAPLFQFGQLRYTSQGILPVAPQSVSFIPSNVQAHYNLNPSLGAPLPIQRGQENSTHSMVKDGIQSVSMDQECTESNAPMHNNQAEFSNPGENKVMPKRGFHGVDKGHPDTVLKSFKPSSNGSVSEGLLPSEQDSRGSKTEGPQFGNKGRNYAHSGRNFGPSSSFAAYDGSRSDSRSFQRRPRRPTQRTEFRVRENVDRRHSQGLLSSSKLGQDDISSVGGRNAGNFVNIGSKKGLAVSNKPSKHIIELEGSCSDPVGSKGTDSEARFDRRMEKEEASTSTHSITRSSGEGNLKRNISSEEDVDAPLQSGIVRVFKQPGIEAPSDGDDFIEVRSKRQMLNDRREQREKEIKAKSRVTKAPRKSRSAQNAQGSMSSNKISALLGGEAPNNIRSNFVASEGRGLLNMEVSTGFGTIVSQPLPPIGTPVALNSDTQADKRPHYIKSFQTGSASGISNTGKNLGPGLTFENKNKLLDNVQSPLGSWDNAQINQQVLALTQTQLDEAMKPGRFDTYAASIGDHTMSNTEPIMPSASILTKDKSFNSAANPINSLLAGEKIQFGAVTSPTVLPPGVCTISHGIGAPGSSRSDIKTSQTLSAAEDCTRFFEKGKRQNESCVDLEDSEAEAEAAASAVAVAAISSDEIVGNGLGACLVSVSDSKSFSGADIDGIGGGVAGDQQLAAQSRAEESLSVALPADLSVDTPSISLWPPLPSPQNASSQMLSHFPGAPPSHFPFYEMNPMLGGPIFAFGPHDDSARTQSQNQKSTASASGPLGSWQQCHSGVDSFYGPQAGFTGPYISPPGGIPGVQCPPHMVVYNHFPVGQFGQVGLSFMGTTYIPSGKQPDWKHNPTSSAMGSGEGDMNSNMNMVSAQRSPLNIPSPVQHISPGSPLLPMASPFAMFDVSPFQSGPEMSVQGRWSHVPAPSLHSVSLSHPLQQPEAGVLLPSQFSHAHQSSTANRFSESRTSTPSDGSRNFPVAPDSAAIQFSDERGLLDSSSSATGGVLKKSSSGSTFAEVGKTDPLPNVNGSGHNVNAFNNHSTGYHSTGYNYQRGGGVVSQKNGSGSEWSQHRRMGVFHGRNQSLGADKSYPPSSKMKQVYVAKQTTSGNSSAV